jgi:hypothetical protein
MTDDISPNTPVGAAAEPNAVASLDSIAAKMTAMRENTLRNQIRATEPTEPGADATAEEDASSPVAPQGAEVADTGEHEIEDANYDSEAQDNDSVSDTDNSSADELIDFIEFAETNPNAKFKFMKNGKEVIVDAKKAAAILGQGSAIHEEARQLKVDRAEFDEYMNEARAQQEGLTLAMEFTVQPKLQAAYDEILKTQNYNSTFHQQLARTTDQAQAARIHASIQQNEQYIRQQQATIGELKPAVDQFKAVRSQQVAERLQAARKGFQDKELKNEYVFKEIREKLGKAWSQSKEQIIPGIDNIDLISSDESLLSLVRDGLRYRDKPSTKAAGASIAALTSRKGTTNTQKGSEDGIAKLREQAKAGDKKAGDNLLMAQLQRMRQGRGSR